MEFNIYYLQVYICVMNESPKPKSVDYRSRSIRVAFFAIYFVGLFLIYLFINTIAYYHFHNFIIVMSELSTPPVPGTLISLDLIGFIMPSIISVFAIVRLLQSKSIHSDYRATILLFTVLAALLIFSTFIHELRSINLVTHSGGPNYWELVTVLYYMAYLLWIRSTVEGRYSSYILGFLAGFLSDLESIRHLTEVTVFGGLGLLDADFVLPLLILISFVLAIRVGTS